MEKSMEKSVSSAASGNSINSKLRYPLRSALRSKEGKPPVPDFSVSSAPRRARVLSAVSQSTTVLDLSAKKSVDRSKPPRRLSIPTKTTSSNSSVKSVSGVSSASESKAKRTGFAKSLTETTFSSEMRSLSRRKVENLCSSTYWLAHINLSESAGKHSISLGFFKLALLAGCEPLERMKEELKSYALRNNLDGLGDAMKELSELYNISEESKQMQFSDTSSVVAEDTTVSMITNNDNDAQSSFSTPGKSEITSEIMKEDASQDSAVIETAKEEESLETIPQGEETRRSLDVINVNQEVVQESEDGVPKVVAVQPSDKKRVNTKEAVSKNNQAARTKKTLPAKHASSRTVPENKSQKKDEKITKARTKKIQEETKKTTKKPTVKEGEVKSVKQMKKMENKENSVVVGAGEEIQV
ncbi:unnamed protein product [Cochlearia groenlandica]